MTADLLLLVGLAALTVYMLCKRAAFVHSGAGYRAVVLGLAWSTITALFDALWVGNSRMFEPAMLGPEASGYLVVLGYFPAIATIIFGLSRWLPPLERLNNEISARQEAEEDRRRTESLLRDAVEALPSALVVFDQDDRLALHNQNHRELFAPLADMMKVGTRFEDLLRTQVSRGLVDDAKGCEEEWIAKRLAKHRNPADEVIQHFQNGRVIRMIERRTAQGGRVAIHTDITDQFNARLAAEKAADAVRVLLETAPVPLAMLRDDELLFANKQMHELLGAPLGSMNGSRGSEIMADFERYQELLQTVEREGAATAFDASLRCRDGRELWATINAAPVEYGSGPAIFIGLLDITVRRDAERTIAESEARFRTIAESMPLPLCIGRQSSGELLFVNEPFRKVLDLGQDDITGQSVLDYFVDPASQMHQFDAIDRDRGIDDWAVEMKTRDGRILSTRHSIRAITVGGEDVLLGVFVDVTEQERTRQELADAKRAAEAANISKSQFLAVMSHELRTPLNAILGFSEVLRDELFGPIGNPRYMDYAADIHDSGQHLLSLISDVLDLSRIEAGRLELNEEDLDPLALVGGCIHYFEGKAREHGTRLVLNDRAGGARLLADERSVRQVLLNLLSNAVKFARQGTPVRIDISRHTDGALSFRVFNEGDGIAKRDLERIMQPFTQLQNAHARREHGTGLGLSITKHLMEAHGGTLVLESQLGHGTAAIATFPAWRASNDTPIEAVAAQ